MLNPIKTLERKLLASTDSIDNAVRRTLGLPETVRADSLRGRRVLNALKVLEEEAKNNGQFNMKKLYKQASDELNKALLKKTAGILADLYAGIPARTALNVIPFVGTGLTTGAETAGLLHGALTNTPTQKELDEVNKSWGKSFIPGVGSSRALRKMRFNARGSKHGTGNIAGEQFGGLTVLLGAGALGALSGAGIGAGVRSADGGTAMLEGAGIGAGMGGVAGLGIGTLAALAGSIAAAIAKRRTAKEQRAHDDEPNAANWIVPGVAPYNAWKRIGRIMEEEEAREPIIAAQKAKEVAEALQKAKKLSSK